MAKRLKPSRLAKYERYAPAWLRLAVLERDDYKCRYCGVPVTDETANIDHVRPWKLGGNTVAKNLVASCRSCNRAKGNFLAKTHKEIRELRSYRDHQSELAEMNSHLKSM